jgi:hypothetical protein
MVRDLPGRVFGVDSRLDCRIKLGFYFLELFPKELFWKTFNLISDRHP